MLNNIPNLVRAGKISLFSDGTSKFLQSAAGIAVDSSVPQSCVYQQGCLPLTLSFLYLPCVCTAYQVESEAGGFEETCHIQVSKRMRILIFLRKDVYACICMRTHARVQSPIFSKYS